MRCGRSIQTKKARHEMSLTMAGTIRVGPIISMRCPTNVKARALGRDYSPNSPRVITTLGKKLIE